MPPGEKREAAREGHLHDSGSPATSRTKCTPRGLSASCRRLDSFLFGSPGRVFEAPETSEHSEVSSKALAAFPTTKVEVNDAAKRRYIDWGTAEDLLERGDLW